MGSVVVSFELPRKEITSYKHRAFVRLLVESPEELREQLNDLEQEFSDVKIEKPS